MPQFSVGLGAGFRGVLVRSLFRSDLRAQPDEFLLGRLRFTGETGKFARRLLDRAFEGLDCRRGGTEFIANLLESVESLALAGERAERRAEFANDRVCLLGLSARLLGRRNEILEGTGDRIQRLRGCVSRFDDEFDFVLPFSHHRVP
ncbi:hypothetical protein [Hartmannibacter diazotrophicus]|uniref:hypothetical protein n=1 Tax=Hartmannibacter diazotrophicus TaxID=1482074 RepID=UPI0012FD546F|nr:hypothetical protein [Hartmannibacter diazotrophicus]